MTEESNQQDAIAAYVNFVGNMHGYPGDTSNARPDAALFYG
jgi:hypothetical protein